MAVREDKRLQLNITGILTDFVFNTKYEDLPPEAVHEAKRILLDTLGVAVAGNTVAKGKLAVKVAAHNGGPQEATIIGGRKVAAANAAFANGELINAMDWDITCPAGHLTPCVTAAPLAIGETLNIDGKSLILATAIAHEVAIRISHSLGEQLSFEEKNGKVRQVLNPTYGFGFSTIAAAAAAGKIAGLTRDELNDAIGLAASFAPVPSMAKWYRTAAPTTMAKYTSAGIVSQSAVTAVQLAQAGYRGDRSVLDGGWGFWRMFGIGSKWNHEIVTNGLGEVWKFTDEINHKVYPCCGVMQIGLDLLAEIKAENDLHPEEIDKVMVFAQPLTQQPIWTSKTVESNVDAQFSVPYVYAAQTLGIPPKDWQLEKTYTRSDVISTMDKIESYVNSDYFKDFLAAPGAKSKPMGGGSPTVVEVCARGKTFSKKGNFAKGHSLPIEYRFTDEEIKQKFYITAGTALSPDQIKELIDKIDELESVRQISEIMSLLAEDKRQSTAKL